MLQSNVARRSRFEVTTMQITGIKRGKTIELPEELDLPDGQAIAVEIIETRSQTEETKAETVPEVFGAWKDDREIKEIFAEIDRERHLYRGREIKFLED